MLTIYKTLTIKMCMTLIRHLEWANVKCKCANKNSIQDLLQDGNSDIGFSFDHFMKYLQSQDAQPWPLEQAKVKRKHANQKTIRDFLYMLAIVMFGLSDTIYGPSHNLAAIW